MIHRLNTIQYEYEYESEDESEYEYEDEDESEYEPAARAVVSSRGERRMIWLWGGYGE